jgi:hypothetical protein
VLNGVDLSQFEPGDILRVPEATAAMLIREGWATLVDGDDVADKTRQ